MTPTTMEETIEKITGEIAGMKVAVERLDALSDGFPALDRNLVRIKASIKMLEINFVEPGQV